MITLHVDEKVADDVFEILNQLIEGAKHEQNSHILAWACPVLVAYGKALYAAKEARELAESKSQIKH